jgi:hypothetical protein
MGTQGLDQRHRHDRPAIPLPLSATNNQLATNEVDVLHAQLHRLQQSQPAAI